jgi:hypothetical protein
VWRHLPARLFSGAILRNVQSGFVTFRRVKFRATESFAFQIAAFQAI